MLGRVPQVRDPHPVIVVLQRRRSFAAGRVMSRVARVPRTSAGRDSRTNRREQRATRGTVGGHGPARQGEHAGHAVAPEIVDLARA